MDARRGRPSGARCKVAGFSAAARLGRRRRRCRRRGQPPSRRPHHRLPERRHSSSPTHAAEADHATRDIELATEIDRLMNRGQRMTDTPIRDPHRQARPRRPRPRCQGARPRAPRRGLRGHLHRAAPDAGDDRGRRRAGGRRRRRPVDPVRRPHGAAAADRGSCCASAAWTTCWSPPAESSPTPTS